jgi:mono/diheme cytochrome c family protein
MHALSKSLCLALSITVLSTCTNTGPEPGPEGIMAMPALRGEEIATRLCSGCHAIGRMDQSAHPDSLPFRQISLRYPVRSLEEALGEGIFVGHPDMPPFQLDPRDIDDLLDYIEAIQDPA